MSPLLRHTLALCLLGILSCGCIINRDISRNPSRYTDFLVGETYRLKRDVSVMESTKSLMPIRVPSQVVLRAGTELRVTRIHYRRNPTIGRYTHVYAKVVGKSVVDEEVVLTWISNENLKTGTTWLDPEYLELVTDEPEK
jgi:hypothetical protein